MSVLSVHEERQSNADSINTSKVKAWMTVAIASLFFLYEFIQMDLFNVISQSLMHDFSITAAQLGTMSTFYFVANVLFLFISGVLLDRYSTRRIILLTMGLCVVATACFALTHNYYWASFFRFLTGVGGAFCFLSVVRLATQWFPASQMAFVTGVIVTIAFVGGGHRTNTVDYVDTNLYLADGCIDGCCVWCVDLVADFIFCHRFSSGPCTAARPKQR